MVSDAESQLRQLSVNLGNWGRWGADDERGTLNLLTAQRLMDAADEVRTGQTISLGLPLNADGPQRGPYRQNPQHFMTAIGEPNNFPEPFHYADDTIVMPLQAATHWDALGHVFYDDMMWNGVAAKECLTVDGLYTLGIGALSSDVVGRGVLLDVARLKGEECLPAGEAITEDDLEAARVAQGVEMRPGDILLVRTGWLGALSTHRSRRKFWNGEPGLSITSAQWLRDNDIAAVAVDNWAVEMVPANTPDWLLAAHLLMIRDMGLTLGELFVLDELAEECAKDGRFTFLLTAPVLRVTGGTGSPLNPLAIR
jgi:kynurenine formamidase